LYLSFNNANGADGEKWGKINEFAIFQPCMPPRLRRFGTTQCDISAEMMPYWHTFFAVMMSENRAKVLQGGAVKDSPR